MRLGALIGQNQSFETGAPVPSEAGLYLPTGWLPGGQTSCLAYCDPVNTHSSGWGANWLTFSKGTAAIYGEYNFYANSSYQGIVFPGVNTHAVAGSIWARHLISAGSQQWGFDIDGTINGRLGGPIVSPNAAMSRYNVDSGQWITNSTATFISVFFNSNVQAASDSILADDQLVRVDELVLHPTWDFQQQARLLMSQFQTQGGNLFTSLWAKRFAYQVPLQWLNNSQADTLNWWWSNQFNLALWLDSSDAESTFIVRIVNETQPIGQKISPYADQWQGVLQLESINAGGLAW